MNQVFTARPGRLAAALSLAAVVAALAVPAAYAATPGSSSLNGIDYPTVVPSTSIVGEGNVQLETNVARAKDGVDPAVTSVWSTPTLLRLGMPNYEIRLQSPVYTHQRTPGNVVNSGMSDITLGLKGVIPQTIDRDLSVAVMLQAAFPSGSPEIKNQGVRPELQAVAAWDLPNNSRISGVMGVRSEVDPNEDRYAAGTLAMNYAYTWNTQVQTYAEFGSRELRTAARGGKDMMYDFGASYAFVPGTQLNAQAGWGLKDNDTDMAWSIGVSTRFRPSMPGAIAKNHDKKPKTDETPSASTEDGK